MQPQSTICVGGLHDLGGIHARARMARQRLSTPDPLRQVTDMGEKERRPYGKTVLTAIRDYCRAHGLDVHA